MNKSNKELSSLALRQGKPLTSGDGKGVSHQDGALFDSLIWLTTEEAAFYLRRTVNALRILVHKKQLRARKFGGRLYFKRRELDEAIEFSYVKGGF